MKIGFIGLGIMGESMCANIVKKHNDTVYCSDLNKDQVRKLAALGAVPCENNIEVAEKADMIISMVPTSKNVSDLYNELLPYITEGMICIDMSTIDPSVSVEVSKEVKAKGAQFADAPVVKSKAAAIEGMLGVLVGCEKSLYPVIEPILRYMGTTVIHMGENGKGLVMKICQNTLVGEIQNGVNETLLMALHYGISIDNFAAAVAAGGANCAYMAVQKDKLKNEDYSVAFSFENMNKDIHICERMAADAGMEMPGMENVKRVFEKGMSAGLAKEDFRATYKVVRGDYDD
ncbi:MAG: NAD(P)-dependent oxidoreductase [Clostridia bacterium]|nr:NAD(P)-dependent oxidoreductase [Clostridia bacterium]